MPTMDFLALAQSRYSVRRFTDRPVSDDALNAILQAGMAAPTACNNQPQQIYVLRSQDALSRLRQCTACHFDAPLCLLVCCDRSRSWKRSFDGADSGDIDASIVVTHMMLEAWTHGVGSTWVMYFDPAKVRSLFALPGGVEPVALLPLGYPAEDARPAAGHTASRPLSDVVTFL